MKISIGHTASMLSLALLLITPAFAGVQEHVGTSCADCSSYNGAFSIANHTGVTISYQVKWGKDDAWQPVSVRSGFKRTHTHALDENRRAPAPYIQFDRFADGGAVTPKEYQLAFHAVGYAGYGATPNTATPKEYEFKFAADRRTLELQAR
jgi:hypothetical protein